MSFSGHRNSNTLNRYLAWGAKNEAKASRSIEAAVALLAEDEEAPRLTEEEIYGRPNTAELPMGVVYVTPREEDVTVAPSAQNRRIHH